MTGRFFTARPGAGYFIPLQPAEPAELPAANDDAIRYLEIFDNETGALLKIYRYDPSQPDQGSVLFLRESKDFVAV